MADALRALSVSCVFPRNTPESSLRLQFDTNSRLKYSCAVTLTLLCEGHTVCIKRGETYGESCYVVFSVELVQSRAIQSQRGSEDTNLIWASNEKEFNKCLKDNLKSLWVYNRCLKATHLFLPRNYRFTITDFIQFKLLGFFCRCFLCTNKP